MGAPSDVILHVPKLPAPGMHKKVKSIPVENLVLLLLGLEGLDFLVGERHEGVLGNRTFGNRTLYYPLFLPPTSRGLGRTHANESERMNLYKSISYMYFANDRGPGRTVAERILVPGRGLEPPRSYPLVPETSASTNSAIRAREEGGAMYARVRGLSIEGT